MRMTTKQREFLVSAAGLEAKQLLMKMSKNDDYNTRATFSADTERYPDNKIPFVDKHMMFLSTHLSTDPHKYISNLRITTRVR